MECIPIYFVVVNQLMFCSFKIYLTLQRVRDIRFKLMRIEVHFIPLPPKNTKQKKTPVPISNQHLMTSRQMLVLILKT